MTALLGHPPLVEQLVAQMGQVGMPFVQFMEKALYSPGLGYYSSGRQQFGEQGDFVTAPDCSPLFSQCLARQCADVLDQLQSPCILEVGGGAGTMAVDLLLALAACGSLPQTYCILELSADLQQKQRQLFQRRAPHLLPRVRWLSAWPQHPMQGIILANELLDAMPVHKFRQSISGWQEAWVTYDSQRFQWGWRPAHDHLKQALEALAIDCAPGYESEINLLLPGWLNAAADCLSRGLLLLIDYGFPRHEYYHPDRSMGTLMCHYRHQAHTDPLIAVGLQDITAHVDFTAVAESAERAGLAVQAYTQQATFLMSCGVTDLLHAHPDTLTHLQQTAQVKQLILPSEMGELFKVIALTKGWDAPLLGFRYGNQVTRL